MKKMEKKAVFVTHSHQQNTLTMGNLIPSITFLLAVLCRYVLIKSIHPFECICEEEE